MAKKGNRRYAYLGEIINVTIREAIPYAR